MLEILIWFI